MKEQKPLRIKKYKNRRLYDSENSCHITKDELIKLILTGRNIVVEDSDGDDCTIEILLQLLLEIKDYDKEKLIPKDFLHFLIRANKNSLETFFYQFLPKAMLDFQKTQKDLTSEFFKNITQINPFLSPFTSFLDYDKQKEKQDEVKELKEQVAKMQAALERLSKN